MAIGVTQQRLDAVAKVTGRARYTDDLGMPGMRHAAYVRSPRAHALVRSIDTAEALALPGVEAVFTAADVPRRRFATAGHPYSLDPAGADVADRRLLTDHARYHGDEVAIVVARDLLTARKAARLVRVEYEELPVLADAEAALAEGAPLIHAWRGPSNLIGEHAFEAGGSMAEALERADVTVEAFLTTSVQQHCHMEPFTAYAYMEDDAHIVIVSSTQIPHICRRIAAQALGLDWACIRVIKPYVGGGFGAKQDVVLEPMVAFLTWKLGGAPVSLELSREECMACTRTRHGFRMHGKAAARKDGTLTGVSLNVLSNTGGYASHGHSIAAAGGGKLAALYPRAVFSYHARTAYTNYPVAGALRGYGAPQVAHAVECLVEDAARALGMDSVEFRLRNVARPGEVNPYTKKVLDTAGIVECLEKGRDMFRWSERRAACLRTGDLRRGVGVACFSYGSSTYPASVEHAGARMILNQDGSVTMMAGATEIGQGADTAFAQMAAETLGLDFSCFRVVSTQDTDVTPFDTGAYASRQCYVASNAIRRCAEQLRGRILAAAGRMLGQPAESLALRGREVVRAAEREAASPRALLSLRDLALESYYNKEEGGQITAEVAHKTRANAPCFGCTFTEIEVDVPLCRMRVVDLLNVHDSGRIISPGMAVGQVQGGVAMGIGWALYEELLVDDRSGRILNNNLLDYKVPTPPDVPDIGAAFVETHEPSGGYGNKALGEPPIVSPAPALRNALLDATGVAVDELPLSPKTLYRHFAAAGLL